MLVLKVLLVLLDKLGQRVLKVFKGQPVILVLRVI